MTLFEFSRKTCNTPYNFTKMAPTFSKRYQLMYFLPDIRYTCHSMIFSSSIEVLLWPWDRTSDTLVVLSKFPPFVVVILWSDFTAEDIPSVKIHEQSKRKEYNLIQANSVQSIQSSLFVFGVILQKTNLVQVFIGGNWERDYITNSLMETWKKNNYLNHNLKLLKSPYAYTRWRKSNHPTGRFAYSCKWSR